MLVQMSGQGATHAIIRVVCHLQSDDAELHNSKVIIAFHICARITYVTGGQSLSKFRTTLNSNIIM